MHLQYVYINLCSVTLQQCFYSGQDHLQCYASDFEDTVKIACLYKM